MRHGADVVNAAQAPTGLDLYLGYIDGAYQSYHALVQRFPGKLIVPIVVFPTTNAGLVGDGPPDNGAWPEWVRWVAMRRSAGADPTMYTDLDQWGTGQQAFRDAGVREPHWWVAAWNGQQTIPSGAIGHQYGNTPGYDLSVFEDYWPGVDPAPVAAPPPPPAPVPVAPHLLEDDVAFLVFTNPATAASPTTGAPNGNDYYLVSGPMVVHFPEYPSASAVATKLGDAVQVSAATLQAFQQASAALKGNLSGNLAVSGSLAVS